MVLKYQSTHALKITLMQKKILKSLLAKISVTAKYKDADEKTFFFFCDFFFLFLNRIRILRLPFLGYLKKNKMVNVSNVALIFIEII